MKKYLLILALAGCTATKRAPKPVTIRITHVMPVYNGVEVLGRSSYRWYQATFDVLPDTIKKGNKVTLYLIRPGIIDTTCINTFKRIK